ncbi:MAG: pilus assembly protein TadG-related protein [Ferrimicrobium sp.]|uniref:pilus assembly protein TadG-related protein n=1 Tax=Ferrimicrobium sp. TaxID=2926050 RepID=UPI002621DE6C|nr:pilus assembly protein TadG-related protein [Ferrimicrobium sp.]
MLPSHREANRRAADSGSALILVPLIALVVVILMTIAINTAALYLAQHQLTEVAEACAIQGTRALDPVSYYSEGVLALAPSAARGDVMACVAHESTRLTHVTVSFPTSLSLTVTLTQRQRTPLLNLLSIDHDSLSASATAVALASPPHRGAFTSDRTSFH